MPVNSLFENNMKNLPKKQNKDPMPIASNLEKKIWGYFLTITSIIAVIVCVGLLIFFVSSFISMSQNIGTESTVTDIIAVSFIIFLIALTAVFTARVGIPIGIYLIFQGRGRPKKFLMKEAIKFGWETFKKNFRFFILLTLITSLVSFIPDLVIKIIMATNWGNPTAAGIIVFILVLTAVILGALVSFGWLKVSLKFVGKESVKFLDVFPSFTLFLKYIAGSILYFLLVLAGFILLVVPGIIWAIKYRFYPYFILEGAGPVEAIKKSGRATQGAKVDLLVFDILIGLIFLAVYLGFALIFLPVFFVAGMTETFLSNHLAGIVFKVVLNFIYISAVMTIILSLVNLAKASVYRKLESQVSWEE